MTDPKKIGSGDPADEGAMDTESLPTTDEGVTEKMTASEDASVSTAPKKAPKTNEELEAELDEVRREKAELAAKLSESPEAQGKRRVAFWRTLIAAVLIVIGCVLAAFAVPAVWLDRTVKDQAVWVDTVAPLAADPGVQNVVADQATSALFTQVDVQKLAEQALPPKLVPFAPAIAGAVRGFVSDQAHAFTKSPQFYQVWVETNKIGQKALITVGTQGSQGALSNQNGKISLDIGFLVDTIKAQLVAKGLGILSAVPTTAVQGRSITLFESPYLAQLQQALIWMGLAALLLPLLAIVALGVGIALAVDRRTSVMWTGIGLVVAMIVPLGSLYLGQVFAVSQITTAINTLPADVANTVFDTLLRYLILAQQFIVVIGLIMFVTAVVAGPAKWAVALREGVSHGMVRIGENWDFGPFGERVLGNKPLLRGSGLVVGVLALIFIPAPKFALIVWIVVLEIIWLLLIEFFGRKRPVRTDGPADGDVAAA
jgi:hypothetical protein